MKDIEQYFPVVLFVKLYKVVLTFESVDEFLKCDHSNESYRAVLSYGAVSIMLSKPMIPTFESLAKIPKCDYSNLEKVKLLSNSFPPRC